jgi:Domain of unknown function (DUF4369)
MKLSKIVHALILIFIPLFIKAQSDGYKVVGDIKGLTEDTKVYLIDGGKRKVIDSTIVKGNRFVFIGKLEEAVHTYLHAGKGSTSEKLADILLDNRIVYVNGNTPKYDSIIVSGSVIDQQWKDWWKEDQRIGYQRYKIRQVYESLVSKKDTANAKILEAIIGQMQAYRVDLLKAYVKRYSGTAAGAALPTLCTISDYLTKADYMEMYNSLTSGWQKSYFGQEILTIARKKEDSPTLKK